LEITRSQGIEECRRCYAGPFHVACYRYHLFQAHPVTVRVAELPLSLGQLTKVRLLYRMAQSVAGNIETGVAKRARELHEHEQAVAIAQASGYGLGPPLVGGTQSPMQTRVMPYQEKFKLTVLYQSYSDCYGAATWGLLYQADHMARLEQLERIRRRGASEYVIVKRSAQDGDVLHEFVPTRPWPWCFASLGCGQLNAATAWWQDQVVEDAILVTTTCATAVAGWTTCPRPVPRKLYISDFHCHPLYVASIIRCIHHTLHPWYVASIIWAIRSIAHVHFPRSWIALWEIASRTPPGPDSCFDCNREPTVRADTKSRH